MVKTTEIPKCHRTTISQINARSIATKIPMYQYHVIHENVSICAITESWLKDDENDLTFKEVPPSGYNIISHPHKMGWGGGIALVYTNYLDIKDKAGETSYINMELLKTKVNNNSTSLALYIIYQMPNASVITFCEELAEALEWDITDNTKQLVMIGDFNIHMDSRLRYHYF